MSARVIILGLAQLVLLPATASSQVLLDGPDCTTQPMGACWAELANESGCYVWNDRRSTSETATWTGRCSAGFADGDGTLTWEWPSTGFTIQVAAFRDRAAAERMLQQLTARGIEGYMVATPVGIFRVQVGWFESREAARVLAARLESERFATLVTSRGITPPSRTAHGVIQDGRMHGHWVWTYADGRLAEGPYLDGERDGHWIMRNMDGTVHAEGPYLDGERDGHWIMRNMDGTVHAEGPYVDGERDGHWILRNMDGTIDEGPYVDGKRNGHWVLRFASGQEEQGPYVNGERHGQWRVEPPNGAIFYVTFARGVRQEP